MRALLMVLLGLTIGLLGPNNIGLGTKRSFAFEAPAKILAVHSYRQDYPWTAAQHLGFRQALANLPASKLEIQTEYLDTKRKALSPDYARLTLQFYREKYRDYIPDAIYVTDDNALNFAITYLPELYPEVPVIFSGVNDYGHLARLDLAMRTGVFEKKTIQPNLQLLDALIGDVGQIIVVGDGSPTYQAIKTELNKELSLKGDLQATFVEDDRLQAITAKLQSLPPQPVILTTLGSVKNESGQVLPLQTTVGGIAGSHHQIVISMEDAYMFDGVLGGFMTSGLAQGRSAGKIMESYLAGRPIADLPPMSESPNEYVFNDQTLQKLGLNLPAEIASQSRLINSRPSFYDRFGSLITGATVLLGIALVITLLEYLRTVVRKNRQLTEQGQRLVASERSLQLESRMLADVERISKTGGWQLDLETNELTWSSETRRIHEVDDSFEPTVEKAIAFYTPEALPIITQAVEQAINAGTPFDLELTIKTALGSLKHVRAMGECVLKDGKAAILIGVFQDITDRRKAEQVVSAAYEDVRLANQAKSEFLAAMSHEFRTPLNAILGFADILAGEYLGPLGKSKYREYAEDISVSGAHLLSLVNEVLDISAIEAGKRNLNIEALDTRDVVEECQTIVAKEAQAKNIRIKLRFDPDLPPLYADGLAIRQVMLNLLANAIKFTAPDGTIVVSATADPQATRIMVSDSGIGIAPEKIPELTDPFTRGERDPHKAVDGWGLGLAICKSLVDLHEGKMEIESTEGTGTSVTLTLPHRRQDDSAPQDAGKMHTDLLT